MPTMRRHTGRKLSVHQMRWHLQVHLHKLSTSATSSLTKLGCDAASIEDLHPWLAELPAAEPEYDVAKFRQGGQTVVERESSLIPFNLHSRSHCHIWLKRPCKPIVFSSSITV